MFGFASRKAPPINTVIGQQAEISGDLHFKGGLHIDGRVQGNVVAESPDSVLTVSEKGVIEGEVRVGNVILDGTVTGDVHAMTRIELAPRARVRGNVYYQVIEMASGAEVNGNLVHQVEAEAAPMLALEKDIEANARPGTPPSLGGEVANS